MLRRVSAGTQPALFGIGIALFTFNPVALTPPLLHMMAKPQDFPRAVGLAAALSAFIFLVVAGAHPACTAQPLERGTHTPMQEALPVEILSERSSLSPGKRLHHQRSSSSHDASPHPQGERLAAVAEIL
jgi:hypothetical protein